MKTSADIVRENEILWRPSARSRYNMEYRKIVTVATEIAATSTRAGTRKMHGKDQKSKNRPLKSKTQITSK